MTNKFAQALKNEDSNESISITENGAVGFARTNSRLVDFFFKVGSMRIMSENDIATQFAEAFAENPTRADELIFMVRDCRGGMGEKRTFEICFKWLVKNSPETAIRLLPLIPEYGSWKTFFALTDAFCLDKNIEKTAQDVVRNQIAEDIKTTMDSEKKSISLMAKWMPSENTSSSDTRRLAKYWRNVLNISSKEYRKTLSKLRAKIAIVESAMSGNKWSEIDYNAVPSKAGMLYRNCFLKHDETRRRKWLEDLASGKENVKINTTSLSIPEMVATYMSYNGVDDKEDPVIEAAWKDLVSKNMIPEGSPSLLPIIDGSGSMRAPISNNSNVKAIHVSIGLGLFLANINTKAWRGMCIEFGSRPNFFQVPTDASLLEQIKIALKHHDCESTNIQKVFDLILRTAIKNDLTQKDIPEVITFSDMEFDIAYYPSGYCNMPSMQKLFEVISLDYQQAGYLLPKMIFWNINSRTGTIPLTENELGVGLLSGYNQGIIQMVLSRKLDPLAILLEKLDSERYNLIREALKR